MTKFIRVTLLFALTSLAPLTAVSAQQASASAAGPRIDRTAVAMTQPPADATAEAQVRQNSVGRPMALMVVGGAALILGLVIGDDVGTLFAISGAVAFLYGLYLYLK